MKIKYLISGSLAIIFLCLSIISCTDENTDFDAADLQELAIDDDSAVVSRTDCHTLYAGMNLEQFEDIDSCMLSAQRSLQGANRAYYHNPTDYNLFQVFFNWINYYKTAVDCLGCEATDCDAYLETSQQMIDCLIANNFDAGLVSSLEDIQSHLVNFCEECVDEDCNFCSSGGLFNFAPGSPALALAENLQEVGLFASCGECEFELTVTVEQLTENLFYILLQGDCNECDLTQCEDICLRTGSFIGPDGFPCVREYDCLPLRMVGDTFVAGSGGCSPAPGDHPFWAWGDGDDECAG